MALTILPVGLGISIVTLVALTAATASMRGSRPSSSAALAALGVVADAQQAGSLLDPKRWHRATLTQMRLQALMAAAFTTANSYMQVKMSLSNKSHPFRSIPKRVMPACINCTRPG
jgi:hypothetical protein